MASIVVKLKKDWFGPDAALHRARDNPHTFPADYKDQLPSSAEVLDAKEAKEVLAAEKEEETPPKKK